MSRTKIPADQGMSTFTPICLWCGKPKGTMVMPGKLSEEALAPLNGAIIDSAPCDECKKDFSDVIEKGGNLIFEVGTAEQVGKLANIRHIPGNDKFYFTGRMVGITNELLDATVVFVKELSEYLYKEEKITDEEMLDNIKQARDARDSAKESGMVYVEQRLFSMLFDKTIEAKEKINE